MPKKIVLITLLLFFSASIKAQTPITSSAPTTPADYFKLARQQTDIRQPGAAPFRMKATFTVTNAIGEKKSGDYSEIWVSPQRWRRDINVGTFHQSSSCVSGTYYRLGTSNTLDETAVTVLGNFTPYIEPVEDEERTNQEWKVKAEKVGDVALQQVTRSAPANNPYGSVITAYWFTPDSGYIRGMQVGPSTRTLYNDVHVELGRALPYKSSVKGGHGKESVEIQIESFQPADTSADDVLVIPQAATSKCVEASLLPYFLNGAPKKKVAPEYPPIARAAHITGDVDLLITIGRDGHVINVTPLGQPRPELAKSAVDALRQYVYEPYLLDGIPTEVIRETAVSYVQK